MKKTTISQGDTLRRSIVLTYDTGSPVNLTGCEAYAHLRTYPGQTLLAEAVCAIDAALGRITATFPAEDTATLDPGDYGYDVRITSEGDVRTLYTERVTVLKPYTELEGGE